MHVTCMCEAEVGRSHLMAEQLSNCNLFFSILSKLWPVLYHWLVVVYKPPDDAKYGGNC